MPTDTSRKRDEELKAVMDKAMAAIKAAVPDLPAMVIIAFPTADPETTCICSGANVPQEQQITMLTIALEGQELDRSDRSTAH